MKNTTGVGDLLDIDRLDSFDDFLTLTQPTNSGSKAIANTLYGINSQKTSSLVPLNKDDYGYVFFTRPQLNLTTFNLRGYRKFYDLLTKDENSILRYIRCMLDPKLEYIEGLKSPFVDNKNPFIPLLTNTIEQMGGWPDPVIESYTTPQGLKREQLSMVDSQLEIYSSFTIDCSFKNIVNDPVSLLFHVWGTYPTLTFQGILAPYNVFMLENALDYNTRIYRLIMDETRTYVKKISATGASYPINIPMGRFFDFKSDGTYNDQNNSINIRFECNGADYNDSILCKEFNMTSDIFNDDMYKLNKGESGHNLVKVPSSMVSMFNYRAYPRINLDTLELEWYIDSRSNIYKKMEKYIKTRINNG